MIAGVSFIAFTALQCCKLPFLARLFGYNEASNKVRKRGAGMSKVDPYSGLPILSRREMKQLTGHELFAYQQRILQYPERTRLLQSIAEQTQEIMARGIERSYYDKHNPRSEPIAQPGYIYLVGGNSVYKIGKSKEIPSRLRSFLQLPFKTRLIHTIPTSDMVWAENYLHRAFAHCRLNGEWFDLTSTEVAWICDLPSLNPA
jgi:hypothetical protein